MDVLGLTHKFNNMNLMQTYIYKNIYMIYWEETLLMEMVGADLAATARIRNGWMKFRELFAISDIQSSHHWK